MNASKKALLLGVMVALGGSVAAPLVASAGVLVDIDVAPPPVRVETIPAPRPGFVWAGGFWEWRGGAHVWVPGRYIRERPGFHWVADGWEQRGPHWHRVPGHWER